MVTCLCIALDFYKIILYDIWKSLVGKQPVYFYLTRRLWSWVKSKGSVAIVIMVLVDCLTFGAYLYFIDINAEEYAKERGYSSYEEYYQATEESKQIEEQQMAGETPTTEVIEEAEETEEKVKCSIINSQAHNGTYLFSPGQGKFFLVIEIEVINNSNLDILVDYNDFKCYCDDYKVNPELLVYREGETLLYGVVEPGRKIKGHICYELPTDFHHLEIKWGMYGQKGIRNKILSKMTVITFTMDR